jgi:hypothetical protein
LQFKKNVGEDLTQRRVIDQRVPARMQNFTHRVSRMCGGARVRMGVPLSCMSRRDAFRTACDWVPRAQRRERRRWSNLTRLRSRAH